MTFDIKDADFFEQLSSKTSFQFDVDITDPFEMGENSAFYSIKDYYSADEFDSLLRVMSNLTFFNLKD